MQLSELKLISASNIIKLRTTAGMTQAELGTRLNYSDKTISKWERGEAIPDAFVLTQLGELFGVSVDYLLSSHDGWEAPPAEEHEEKQFCPSIIIAIAFLGVWTVALAVFVALWLFGVILWQIFAITLSVSLLTLIVLLAVFKRNEQLQYAIAAFVLSLFLLLFVFLPSKNPWQLFLIAIPAIAIAFLSCNIRKRPRKHREN